MIPSHMDREQFAERKVLSAEYLARIARATDEQRKELLVEWAEKLHDRHAQRRIGLMKSLGDLSPLLDDLNLHYSVTVMLLLAAANQRISKSRQLGSRSRAETPTGWQSPLDAFRGRRPRDEDGTIARK